MKNETIPADDQCIGKDWCCCTKCLPPRPASDKTGATHIQYRTDSIEVAWVRRLTWLRDTCGIDVVRVLAEAGDPAARPLDPAVRSVLEKALHNGGNLHAGHEPMCLIAPGWRMHNGVATNGSSKNEADCSCWVRDAKMLLDASSAPVSSDPSVEDLTKKLEHTKYWYSCRLERLRALATKHGLLTEFISIVANGTAEPGEPPTYAQQYNMMKHRAEKAEAALHERVAKDTAVAPPLERAYPTKAETLNTGPIDALQIVQQDRDVWKQRALQAELQIELAAYNTPAGILMTEFGAALDLIAREHNCPHCSTTTDEHPNRHEPNCKWRKLRESHRERTAPASTTPASLHTNPDAAAWAAEFKKTCDQLGKECDEGWMLGWFANAMMAMHDHLANRGRTSASRESVLLDTAEQMTPEQRHAFAACAPTVPGTVGKTGVALPKGFSGPRPGDGGGLVLDGEPTLGRGTSNASHIKTVAAEVLKCATAHEPNVLLIGNVRADDVAALARAVGSDQTPKS